MMDELITKLQKASSAVYLAAEKPVADDISALMREALRELQSCREENERLLRLKPLAEKLIEADKREWGNQAEWNRKQEDIIRHGRLLARRLLAIHLKPHRVKVEGWADAEAIEAARRTVDGTDNRPVLIAQALLDCVKEEGDE